MGDFRSAIVLLTILALGCAKMVTFKDCGSVGGKINSVDLSPCTTEPCQLTGGNNYSASVNFTSNEGSNAVTTKVYGIIAGVPVPFPVPSDACNNHNLKCPVVAGSTFTYTNSIYCSPDYPKIKLLVKWTVVDDNGKNMFCWVAPLEIV